MTIGERLKFVRKENKFSFEEAAKVAGVVRSMIQRWEKGESETISTTYLTFIYKLGYSIEWILLGINPQKRKKEESSAEIDLKELKTKVDVLEDLLKIQGKKIKELENIK